MNKPADLGLSILHLSKTAIYEFWYDYIKPKYGEKTKLCYMGTDSFIVHVKTDDIYRWYLRYCSRRWNKIWYFKL